MDSRRSEMIRKILNKADVVRIAGAAVVLLGLSLAMALPAGAVPQIMTSYGDQMPWLGADINAMGSTGAAIYRGAASNIFNPAYLAVEDATQLDLGISFEQEHEDRFQPLFDTFDNVVTDAAIAGNRNHYLQGSFGIAHRVLRGSVPVTGALSLTGRRPYSYDFDEELRNPDSFGDDEIMENRSRKVEGTLRYLSLGAGAQVFERVAVGAAVHYAFGKKIDTRQVRDFITIDGDSSYSEERTYDMDGVNFTLGLDVAISQRLELGLAWESSLTASGDFGYVRNDPLNPEVSSTQDGHYKYPSAYRGGLTFRPRTDPKTVMTFDLEYIPWKDMEDTEHPGDDNPQNLADTWDVRIGLQHTFQNGVPLRFGFRRFDTYADGDVGASVFSAGTGFPLGGGLISATVELNKTTAVLEHQFPYPPGYFGPQYEADPQARVEDTRFRIGLGYTLNF